jgi:hypothetical protein
VFSELFEHILGMATSGLRRKTGEAVRLIDSTSLPLTGVGAQWERFSADVNGAKAHIVYAPDLGGPVYHAITPANVDDIAAAKQIPIIAGGTYVFDLGYYDYGWWARLHEAGCRIVTRFKSNTRLHQARAMPLARGSSILSDRIGFLHARQQEGVREVVVQTQTGKKLRILSNDLAPGDR